MKTNLTDENRALNGVYSEIRTLREGASRFGVNETRRQAEALHARLEAIAPHDWLARWELLELDTTLTLGVGFRAELEKRLAEISKLSRDRREMIARGLKSLGLSGWHV
jgi:hypothetical protein